MVILVDWLWFAAITFGPFIFIRKKDYHIVLLNHEYIHLYQQKELFFAGAYVVYVVEYFCKLLYYRSFKKAYYNVSFEREAFLCQNVVGYCANRKPFTSFKFIYVKNPVFLNDKIETKEIPLPSYP